MREITKIILHCSATREGGKYTAADIKRWHLQRGFSDIGYHYVIEADGRLVAGRPAAIMGAHCKVNRGNHDSIGICYVGGLDKDGKPKDTRTAAQKQTIQTLLTALHNIWPKAKVYGHRDFANVECPCFDAKSEYIFS